MNPVSLLPHLVYCLYHSRTLHPFNVTEPAQSLCSDEVYYVLTFYYFIQLLVSFYSPYTVFNVWAEYLGGQNINLLFIFEHKKMFSTSST